MPRHCELHVNAHGVTLHVPGHHGPRQRPQVDGLIALRPDHRVAFDRSRPAWHRSTPRSPRRARRRRRIGQRRSRCDRGAAGGAALRAARRVRPGVRAQFSHRRHHHARPRAGLRSALDDAGLSRQHARLTPMDKGLLVEDLGSTNGCFVNGKRVQRALAVSGDEIGSMRSVSTSSHRSRASRSISPRAQAAHASRFCDGGGWVPPSWRWR